VKKKEEQSSKSKSIAVYAGVGMSFAAEMGMAVGLGWWLGSLADKRWGIKPWGMVAGIVLFLFAALFHIARLLIRLQGEDDEVAVPNEAPKGESPS
jgi:F0F1-type ATP synthase assembly protein I